MDQSAGQRDKIFTGEFGDRTDAAKAARISAVYDEGPGIAPEMRERIFDKFYQGDLSHASSGNGLGLTIVRKILELHGGSISVADSKGGGAIFEVKLPLG